MFGKGAGETFEEGIGRWMDGLLIVLREAMR